MTNLIEKLKNFGRIAVVAGAIFGGKAYAETNRPTNHLDVLRQVRQTVNRNYHDVCKKIQVYARTKNKEDDKQIPGLREQRIFLGDLLGKYDELIRNTNPEETLNDVARQIVEGREVETRTNNVPTQAETVLRDGQNAVDAVLQAYTNEVPRANHYNQMAFEGLTNAVNDIKKTEQKMIDFFDDYNKMIGDVFNEPLTNNVCPIRERKDDLYRNRPQNPTNNTERRTK